MPLPMATEVRDSLYERDFSGAWIIEMFTDQGVLRAWDRRVSLSFEGHTFEAVGDQFQLEGELKTSVDLIPEPIIIMFDAAAVLDSDTLIGRLVDRTWYQRRFRLRQLALVPMKNGTEIIGAGYDWYGYMDNIEETIGDGGKPIIALTCESGIFRSRGRNYRTYTDADQRQIDPDDPSFKNTATKPFQSIPFGESWSNVPGYQGNSSGNSSQGSANIRQALFGF